MDTETLKDLDPDNYVRLFEFKNLPVMYDSLWLQYYQHLDAICINVNQLRTSYIPVLRYKETLAAGKELFANIDSIRLYREEFDLVEKKFLDLTENLITDSNLLLKLPEIFYDWFRLYSFTDFHCTNDAQEDIEINFTDFGKYKEKKRETINKIAVGEDSYLMQFFWKHAHALGITREDLLLHTYNELLNDNIHNVLERKDSVYAKSDDKDILIEGILARDIAKKFRSNCLGKGIVVNKGKAQGVAFVFHNDISNTRQIAELSKRLPTKCVLICETTSPDLSPLYKDAVALVTAQGGVMSHAAIIAREANMPCIVGMENVTRYFNTGDIVEVDANNGVIKILKKAPHPSNEGLGSCEGL